MNDKELKDYKPTESEKKALKSSLDVPKGIPVRLLRFAKNGMQVPGHQATPSVTAKKEADGRVWEIEFIPQIRHHKITCTWPQKERGVQVAFVWEGNVDTWEPL